MKKKFKIYHSKEHQDNEKAGKRYRPSNSEMLVMGDDGAFFVIDWGPRIPSLRSLNSVVGDYDVIWRKAKK